MATLRGVVHLNRFARVVISAKQTLSTQKVVLSHPVAAISRFDSKSFSTSSSLTAKFEVINIQDEEHFKKEVLDSKDPVVVDFHATWCGPCKMLAPRLEKVMSQDGSMKLVKVDIDKFEDLAIKYRVRGVPAVFGFKNGKSVDSFVGVAEEDKIEGFVSKLSSH